jgi:hypothetical protein
LRPNSSQCSRPSRAFGVSKGIKHAAVEATQDAAHKIERAIIGEIGSVNCCAIDFPREKAGAIALSLARPECSISQQRTGACKAQNGLAQLLWRQLSSRHFLEFFSSFFGCFSGFL